MSTTQLHLAAADLRREFDRSFSLPWPQLATGTESYLLVRAAGRPLALRVTELRSVARCPPVVALPSSAPHLLGVASIDGRVVGLYDLARFFDLAAPEPAGRWVALCGDGSVGLVFAELLGVAERREAASPAPHRKGPGGELVTVDGVPHELVDVVGLVATIEGAGDR